MFLSWIVVLLSAVLVDCLENGKQNEVQLVVEYPGNKTFCDAMEVVRWSSGFHNCFFERKYRDGGQNLDTIVDRILQHAEECEEHAIRTCQPDFEGFKDIMSKIISQIKDYSEMYLAEIFKGRENIKDLECVEKILSLDNYVKCFKLLLRSPSVSQKSFERGVTDSIACTTRANVGCSDKAKYSMDRIVGSIFGLVSKRETKQPPPSTQPPRPSTRPPPPSTRPPPPMRAPATEPPVPEPAPEPEKRWYDYIFQPFISAWNAVRSFFGW